MGDFHAALEVVHSAEAAHRYNITAVVNVAWDFDLPANVEHMSGTAAGSNLRYQTRYSKVGLVDGPGNSVTALATAVQIVGALLHADGEEYLEKDVGTFAHPRGGAVLVHCALGRSRSVTVAALALFYSKRFSSFDAALAWVQRRRKVRALLCFSHLTLIVLAAGA